METKQEGINAKYSLLYVGWTLAGFLLRKTRALRPRGAGGIVRPRIIHNRNHPSSFVVSYPLDEGAGQDDGLCTITDAGLRRSGSLHWRGRGQSIDSGPTFLKRAGGLRWKAPPNSPAMKMIPKRTAWNGNAGRSSEPPSPRYRRTTRGHRAGLLLGPQPE
jgi:hypothetical protein